MCYTWKIDTAFFVICFFRFGWNLGMRELKLYMAMMIWWGFIHSLRAAFGPTSTTDWRSSGYQRHGMRISQCDKKAIYLVEVGSSKQFQRDFCSNLQGWSRWFRGWVGLIGGAVGIHMILELQLLHIEWGFELASCNGSKLVLSSVSSENRMVKQPYFAGNSAGALFGMVLCPFKGIVGDLLTESKGHGLNHRVHIPSCLQIRFLIRNSFWFASLPSWFLSAPRESNENRKQQAIFVGRFLKSGSSSMTWY